MNATLSPNMRWQFIKKLYKLPGIDSPAWDNCEMNCSFSKEEQ